MDIKALTIDVFVPLVDWRTAAIRELEQIGQEKQIHEDWSAFVDEWKSTYRKDMDAVNAKKRPWANIDIFFRDRLEELIPLYRLDCLTETERQHLNLVWTRPDAWPDVSNSLMRLKSRFIVSTLSNGNFSWLVSIARHCKLNFDCVLTAENARAYKPDGKVYQMAIELLALDPGSILMVACHNYDLIEAKKHGMQTAFIPRLEHGPGQIKDQQAEKDWDFIASDLADLATQLGC